MKMIMSKRIYVSTVNMNSACYLKGAHTGQADRTHLIGKVKLSGSYVHLEDLSIDVICNLKTKINELTSSQATTVGPSHWAKGKPFLLASSSSSCLRVQGQKRRHVRARARTSQSTHHTLLNSLTSSQ